VGRDYAANAVIVDCGDYGSGDTDDRINLSGVKSDEIKVKNGWMIAGEVIL
jgi:hypothetical protein